MQLILTPNETRNADFSAINEFGIKGEILMENAARSVSDILSDMLFEAEFENASILILCGSGNNGGDGFAAARHLSNYFDVRIAWIGSPEKMSPETKTNFEICNKMGIEINHLNSEEEISQFDFDADVICDALIGIGGTEELNGLVVDLLQVVNSIDAFKVAIDVPTGLNSHTGAAHEDAFIADLTITMFAPKTGMLLNDGLEICGEIEIASLGAPERIVADIAKNAILEDEDISDLLPLRYQISSKFDYGKVLIIAGSQNMPGAAALTANAAIKSGAGLVYLMTTSIHPALKPEIIPTLLPSDANGFISYKSKSQILEAALKSDVIVFGPGMGNTSEINQLIGELLAELPDNLPIILDADALKVVNHNTILRKNVLLTPHIGEFANLIGLSREDVILSHSTLAKEWAQKLNCTILLKHVPSIITDGDFSIWNIGGNPGMATAGSGDVLTGIISALLAQCLEPLDSAAVGAYLHSKAGDEFAQNNSEISLTASDIINDLDKVMKAYEN